MWRKSLSHLMYWWWICSISCKTYFFCNHCSVSWSKIFHCLLNAHSSRSGLFIYPHRPILSPACCRCLYVNFPKREAVHSKVSVLSIWQSNSLPLSLCLSKYHIIYLYVSSEGAATLRKMKTNFFRSSAWNEKDTHLFFFN